MAGDGPDKIEVRANVAHSRVSGRNELYLSVIGISSRRVVRSLPCP